MTHLITKTSIIVVSVFLLAVASLFTARYYATQTFSKADKIRRIAIFEPAIHPAMDEICQGFIDTLSSEKYHYEFKRFNANGNKILMHAQAEEILNGNFDLVFTIGVGCSLTIKDLCVKQNCATPIVFTAVDDPERLALTGQMITGVTEQSDYRKQLDLLVALKPSIKQIMLVYDPCQGSGLEKDKQEIGSILKEKNISLLPIELTNVSEMHQKISAFMHDTDAVMILKDNTIVSGIDSLITLCQRYHIPLLASDLNSGQKGAVLAFGIREYDSGVEGANKAKLILEEGKKPSEVPVTTVQHLKMRVNCRQMEAQGLLLDPAQKQLPGIEIE